MHKYQINEVQWERGLPVPMPDIEPIVFEAVDDAEARRVLAIVGHVSGRHFRLIAEPTEAA